MKKVFTLFGLLLILVFITAAQNQKGGNFISSYAILNTGSGNTYYDCNASTGNPDFNGNSIGNFKVTETLKLEGSEVNVWKDDGHNIAWVRMFYRIYLTGTNPPAFTQIDLAWRNTNGNDEKWDQTAENIDCINDKEAGDYTIEVYFHARWEKWENDFELYDNNGGNNYKASFTILANESSGSGNWDEQEWTYGSIPVIGDPVTIKEGHDVFIDVDQNANANHLLIDGTLTLKSTASGTASLITNGTVSGEVTVERYLSQDIYHYISSPINYPQGNSPYYFDQLNLGLASGDNFRRYETATNTWIDILNGPDGTIGNSDDLMDDETFQQGMGYAIAYAGENKTLSFTGSPNNGSISLAVSSGGVGNNSGANFIGNPYPSTVQASSFISDNSSILSGKLYFWDEPSSGDFGKSDYATRTSSSGNPGGGGNSPTDFIDPGQGFFVVAESDGNVTFQNSQRVHGSSVFFKNESVIKDFKLTVKNLETKDRNTITVVFDENSTEGFDKLYDAPKWQGNPDLALYTLLGDQKLAINSLPELTDPVMVSVGLNAQNTGSYKFSVHTKSNFDPNTPITLEDRLTGDQVDLTLTPEYSFMVSEPGTFDDRFVLYFKSAVGVGEHESAKKPLLRLQNHLLRITNLDQGDYRIRITDITGRIMMVDDFTAERSAEVPVSLKTGIYIVEIFSENHIFANKLYVQ